MLQIGEKKKSEETPNLEELMRVEFEDKFDFCQTSLDHSTPDSQSEAKCKCFLHAILSVSEGVHAQNKSNGSGKLTKFLKSITKTCLKKAKTSELNPNLQKLLVRLLQKKSNINFEEESSNIEYAL